MSLIDYRANLMSGHMPFLSQLHGRTVIIPNKDQAFQNNVFQTAADYDNDKGFPQVYYHHNVMPTGEGMQSVGYDIKIPGLDGAVDFSGIFILRDTDENKFLFSPGGNKNYVFDGVVGEWRTNTGITDIGDNQLVTIAYIAGNTYIFFQGVGCYQYDITTHSLLPVTLIGLTVSAINGITESSGFLLAYDDFNIYRSQITNPLNFTPDTTLGSGASIPEDLNGKIVVCYPTTGGFIIYCTKNAVGASFSQNIRFPFIYKEIRGSAGINNYNHVAWNHNGAEHYAWTLAGLQRVNRTEATLVFAQLTDVLTSKIFEDFDSVTNSIVITKLNSQPNIRLAMIGERWFSLSYGINGFTHIWVIDLAFKRWGKLKRTHVAAFELYLPNFYGEVRWLDFKELTWADLGDTTWADLAMGGVATSEYPREIFALLLADGTVEVVNFDSVHTDDEGVLILGKYQFVREHLLSMQEINIENVDPDYNFDLKILSSYDGKNVFSITSPYLAKNSGLYRKYNSTVQGLNHSLLLQGTFHIPCVEMKLKVESRS